MTGTGVPLFDPDEVIVEDTVPDPDQGAAFEVDPDSIEEPRKKRRTKLRTDLETLYGSIGVAVTMFDPFCGTQIVGNAPAMAESLDSLASKNIRVKRVLEKILATSAFSEVVTAHLPVVMAIATHHVPHLREQYVRNMNAQYAEQNGTPA